MKTKETLFMYSKKILLADDTQIFFKMIKDFFRREQVDILRADARPESTGIQSTNGGTRRKKIYEVSCEIPRLFYSLG